MYRSRREGGKEAGREQGEGVSGWEGQMWMGHRWEERRGQARGEPSGEMLNGGSVKVKGRYHQHFPVSLLMFGSKTGQV